MRHDEETDKAVKAAVEKEREACAQIAYCEAVRWAYTGKPIEITAAKHIADIIRARGNE